MTAEEYLDAKRFPVTTPRKLSLRDQLFIDAINRDDLVAMRERGEEMNAVQKLAWAELEAKAADPPPAPTD